MNWLTDTILRWDGPPPPHDLLAEGGVTALLGKGGGGVRYVAWAESGPVKPQDTIAVTDGLWPGIAKTTTSRRDPDNFVAAASRQPWVDANGYLVSCLRAIRPGQPALLAPKVVDGTAYSSLELALIEARLFGGNFLLGLAPDYREALLAGQPKAREAWRQLGQTARWLDKQRALFGHPVRPVITQVVDSTGESAEFSNLLHRQIASPALVPAGQIPGPDPQHRLAIVAVGISNPGPTSAVTLLDHARAGSTLVTETRGDSPWWRVNDLKLGRKEGDRDFYALGKGHVVAYHEPVEDPSEFALDVIDIVTHKKRALRIWDAPTVIGLATQPPGGGRILVLLVNYGEPRDYDFPLRAQGVFAAATLLRPGQNPLEVKAVKRAATTEVRVPSIGRAAILVLS